MDNGKPWSRGRLRGEKSKGCGGVRGGGYGQEILIEA